MTFLLHPVLPHGLIGLSGLSWAWSLSPRCLCLLCSGVFGCAVTARPPWCPHLFHPSHLTAMLSPQLPFPSGAVSSSAISWEQAHTSPWWAGMCWFLFLWCFQNLETGTVWAKMLSFHWSSLALVLCSSNKYKGIAKIPAGLKFLHWTLHLERKCNVCWQRWEYQVSPSSWSSKQRIIQEATQGYRHREGENQENQNVCVCFK